MDFNISLGDTGNSEIDGGYLFYLDTSIRIICWIILGLTFLVGFSWNMLVWYPVYAAKTLRTSMNALILNLAIIDQLMCVIGIPILAIILVPRDLLPIPDYLCDVYLFVLTLGVTVQLLTLVSISFERYQAISHPFQKKKTLKRVQASLVLVWITGSLVAMISFVSMADTHFPLFCKQTPYQLENFYNYYVFYLITPMGVFSLGLIIFFYGKIISLVNSHVKKTNATLRHKKKSRVFPMETDNAMTASHVEPTNTVEIDTVVQNGSDEADTKAGRDEILIPSDSIRRKSAPDPNVSQSIQLEIDERENVPRVVADSDRSVRFSLKESISHSACDLSSLQKDSVEHDTIAHDKIPDPAQNHNSCKNDDTLELSGKRSGHKHTRCLSTENRRRLSLSMKGQRAFESFNASLATHNVLPIETLKDKQRNSSPAVLGQLHKKKSLEVISTQTNQAQRLSLNTSINSRVKRVSMIQTIFRRWKEANTHVENTDAISNASPEKLPLDLVAVSISDIKNEEDVARSSEDIKHNNVLHSENKGAQGRLVEVVGIDGDKTIAATNRAEIVGAICVFNPKNKERGKRKMEASAAKRAAFIICSYILCWLPYPMINFIFMRPTKTNIGIVNDLQMLTICLLLMTVALNPLLHGLINQQFKKEYKKFINKLKLRCNSDKTSME